VAGNARGAEAVGEVGGGVDDEHGDLVVVAQVECGGERADVDGVHGARVGQVENQAQWAHVPHGVYDELPQLYSVVEADGPAWPDDHTSVGDSADFEVFGTHWSFLCHRTFNHSAP
jgi:hypothetical protein